MIIPARTLHTILFFSDKGKVYSEKVFQLADAGRTDRGVSIFNVLALSPEEKITAAVAVPDFGGSAYCTMTTVRGRIKRVALSEFAQVRPSGLIAMSLDDGDTLGWVSLTSGNDEVILVTQNGQALRYSEKEIRSMGRPAGGVTGINLKKGDLLAGVDVARPGADLLVVTDKGHGKRTPIEEYAPKGRGTMGVTTIDQKSLDKIGKICSALMVDVDDEITLISARSIIIRMKVREISQTSRATRGVRLMNLEEGDSVASLARIPAAGLLADDDKENDRESEKEEAKPAAPDQPAEPAE